MEDENAGDIYIPTKSGCEGGVGKIPISAHRDLGPGDVLANHSMVEVVNQPPMQGVNKTCSDPDYSEWTGADLRRDGRLLMMIRAGPPAVVYFFPRGSDQSIVDALKKAPCSFVAHSEEFGKESAKYEAVAFVDPTGNQFAEISEDSSSLYQYELIYPTGSEDSGAKGVGFYSLLFYSGMIPLVFATL